MTNARELQEILQNLDFNNPFREERCDNFEICETCPINNGGSCDLSIKEEGISCRYIRHLEREKNKTQRPMPYYPSSTTTGRLYTYPSPWENVTTTSTTGYTYSSTATWRIDNN